MTLEDELKHLIVEALQLEDVAPASIDVTGSLFGEGLGLDSIDVLELATAIERKYGVKFAQNSPEVKQAFASVAALAAYIAANRAAA
ncbi:MAG: acyl carrier protein [Myxococcales bacterium]|nr:acyl carrier protein [Myxococcales bacterium]